MSDVSEKLNLLKEKRDILRTRIEERFSDKATVKWLRAQPALGTTHPGLIELTELEDKLAACEQEILSLTPETLPVLDPATSDRTDNPENASDIKREIVRTSQLTLKAKQRLDVIKPIIISFYQSLMGTMPIQHSDGRKGISADAQDWKHEAIQLVQDNAAWHEIITDKVLREVNFTVLAAVTDQRRRLRGELAQIILESEGYGKINRKTLLKYLT